jgi:hypothetical protein
MEKLLGYTPSGKAVYFPVREKEIKDWTVDDHYHAGNLYAAEIQEFMKDVKDGDTRCLEKLNQLSS